MIRTPPTWERVQSQYLPFLCPLSFRVGVCLNPNTGRFWTLDVYEGYRKDPPTAHKYSYCKQNPGNGTDPSGYSEYDAGSISEVSQGLIELAGIVSIAAVSTPSGLHFHQVDHVLGEIERLMAVEVVSPGEPTYDFLDAERGLWGLGAVIVNRVNNPGPRFPKKIEDVILNKEFKNFDKYYDGLPPFMKRNISELDRLANLTGSKVQKYRRHMQAILDTAMKVFKLEDLDIFAVAGQVNAPTLYLRSAGADNPWFDGKKTAVPEYRGTAGGNDFYSERKGK